MGIKLKLNKKEFELLNSLIYDEIQELEYELENSSNIEKIAIDIKFYNMFKSRLNDLKKFYKKLNNKVVE